MIQHKIFSKTLSSNKCNLKIFTIIVLKVIKFDISVEKIDEFLLRLVDI